MPNIIRIKRRLSGDAGAPQSLENGELAFNEVDNTLYYGALSSIDGIAGSGSFATLNTSQTISGDKTFANSVTLSSAVADTKVVSTSSDYVATTEFVQNVFSILDGGYFDENGGGGGGSGFTGWDPDTEIYYINDISTTLNSSGYGTWNGNYYNNGIIVNSVSIQGYYTNINNDTTLNDYYVSGNDANAFLGKYLYTDPQLTVLAPYASININNLWYEHTDSINGIQYVTGWRAIASYDEGNTYFWLSGNPTNLDGSGNSYFNVGWQQQELTVNGLPTIYSAGQYQTYNGLFYHGLVGSFDAAPFTGIIGYIVAASLYEGQLLTYDNWEKAFTNGTETSAYKVSGPFNA